ncbi:MAG: hypothetical protein GTO40_13150 [Deltaproteobacteria bacterium]|nr:hypothetical protein [Deltaproteobacteria bacterium]
MKFSSQWRKGIGVLVAVCYVSGCASTFANRTASYNPVVLERPKTELAEEELLGVRVKPFEPGEIPKEKKKKERARGLSGEIRKAEGYYSAVQLRNAMQQSGYWGPVRVVPDAVTGGEVVITGKILESDGEIIKLEISVQDATGRVWFEKEYEQVIDIARYGLLGDGDEPFQYLYNRIANDVAEFRQNMSPKDVKSVRQVAELKFAEEFAPDAFKGYLVNGDPKTQSSSIESEEPQPSETSPVFKVARLPADDDEMLGRIRRIRVREEALVDTLDLQFERLSREMGVEYTQWRNARLNEMNAVREVEKKRNERVSRAVALTVLGALAGVGMAAAGGSSGAAIGGVMAGSATVVGATMAMEASRQAKADMEIHQVALEELGNSLTEDLKVTVVEIEGETVELRGTAEAKFKQWREMLNEIHKREVGELDPFVPSEGQSADPSESESAESTPAPPAQSEMETEQL